MFDPSDEIDDDGGAGEVDTQITPQSLHASKLDHDAPPSSVWYTPRSAATQARFGLRVSTSMAFMGSVGSPGDLSIHAAPPLSDLKTRPPLSVVDVAHMRLRLFGSAKTSLTYAPLRGVVSAVSAGHAVPFHVVR